MTEEESLESFQPPFIRHPHERERDQRYCGSEMRTKQSFKDECDINKILDRWKATGLIDRLQGGPPTYGDFTNVDDYLSACVNIKAAEDSFATLPSDTRAKFYNNPALLLRFLDDPENAQEAVELGLMAAPATPEPAEVPSPPAPEPTPPAGGEPPLPTPDPPA